MHRLGELDPSSTLLCDHILPLIFDWFPLDERLRLRRVCRLWTRSVDRSWPTTTSVFYQQLRQDVDFRLAEPSMPAALQRVPARHCLHLHSSRNVFDWPMFRRVRRLVVRLGEPVRRMVRLDFGRMPALEHLEVHTALELSDSYELVQLQPLPAVRRLFMQVVCDAHLQLFPQLRRLHCQWLVMDWKRDRATRLVPSWPTLEERLQKSIREARKASADGAQPPPPADAAAERLAMQDTLEQLTIDGYNVPDVAQLLDQFPALKTVELPYWSDESSSPPLPTGRTPDELILRMELDQFHYVDRDRLLATIADFGGRGTRVVAHFVDLMRVDAKNHRDLLSAVRFFVTSGQPELIIAEHRLRLSEMAFDFRNGFRVFDTLWAAIGQGQPCPDDAMPYALSQGHQLKYRGGSFVTGAECFDTYAYPNVPQLDKLNLYSPLNTRLAQLIPDKLPDLQRLSLRNLNRKQTPISLRFLLRLPNLQRLFLRDLRAADAHVLLELVRPESFFYHLHLLDAKLDLDLSHLWKAFQEKARLCPDTDFQFYVNVPDTRCLDGVLRRSPPNLRLRIDGLLDSQVRRLYHFHY